MTRHVSERMHQQAGTKDLVVVELATEYRASLRTLERIIPKGGFVVIAEGSDPTKTYRAGKRTRRG